MRCLFVTLLGALVAAVPSLARAQTALPAAAPPAPASAAAVDASAMGISLSRISRLLNADAATRPGAPALLKFEYHIDVYAEAPELRFFTGQDLVYGGVPGSAPTHRDMVMHVTPQAFRSPRADVLGLVSSAAMFGARKARERDYDRQYEAYRKLVEAGRNVPPPKPPQ